MPFAGGRVLGACELSDLEDIRRGHLERIDVAPLSSTSRSVPVSCEDGPWPNDGAWVRLSS